MRSNSLLLFILVSLNVASALSSGAETVGAGTHIHIGTQAKPKAKPQPIVNRPPTAPKTTPSTNKPAPQLNPPSTPKSPLPATTPVPASKLPPARSCKQLAVEEAIFEQLDQEENTLNGFDKRSPHADLVRRGKPKEPKGKNRPCGANKFASNNFESFGVEKVQNPDAPVYGYQVADSCDSYSWYRGETRRNLKPTLQNYHTEHVLEWQTVADFFGKYLVTHFNSRQFQSPDPEDTNAGKRNSDKFCPTWKMMWAERPADQTFALVTGGERRTPFQHIADVYPSSEARTPNYRNEFTLLQAQLNTLKSRFFSTSVLYDEQDKTKKGKRQIGMINLVKEEPRQAILRLRNVLGVRKYLDQAKVRTSMRDVKTRLQTRFDALETALALPANRRVIPPATGRRPVTGRTFDPWQPLGLGGLWHTYMNALWAEAKQKHEGFLQKWHQKVYETYCTPALKKNSRDATSDSQQVLLRKRNTRDACPMLEAFRKEWNNSKKTPTAFSRPWP
ncbi:hypothetical protein E8E13_001126 [Curvularia kusanoi]|uniref:Uncharacterized protein n=1 Tax=Curvularia kusanoi TaxID=90978 RepID=A0A9P4T2W4_CURKU|nr:hypothetical protein E8E13_001126 [Curvularia kusanoi]